MWFVFDIVGICMILMRVFLICLRDLVGVVWVVNWLLLFFICLFVEIGFLIFLFEMILLVDGCWFSLFLYMLLFFVKINLFFLIFVFIFLVVYFCCILNSFLCFFFSFFGWWLVILMGDFLLWSIGIFFIIIFL